MNLANKINLIKPPNLIVFDVDGTLINIDKLSTYLGNKMNTELNIKKQPNISFTNLFSSYNDCVKFFKVNNPYTIYDKHLNDYMNDKNEPLSIIYEDTLTTLTTLYNRVNVNGEKENDIILLSNRTSITEYINKYYPCFKTFTKIIITANPRKPNPDCLIPFLEYKNIIKIGDSLSDKQLIINAKQKFFNNTFDYYLVNSEKEYIEYNDPKQIFRLKNLLRYL